VCKSLLIGIAAAAVATLALAGAATPAAMPGAGSLPNGWTHASINVVEGGVPHTLVYDRGQVQAVTPTSLTLREADGSVVTVAIGPATQCVVNGGSYPASRIPAGAVVTTLQVDGSAAERVQAQVPQRLLVPVAGNGRKVGRKR
jgi:hypothetical protein